MLFDDAQRGYTNYRLETNWLDLVTSNWEVQLTSNIHVSKSLFPIASLAIALGDGSCSQYSTHI